MKVFELQYLLKDLPSDANIDILHVTPNGYMRSYAVVNITEDQLGSHLIVASKRQLMEEATPECELCGRKLRNSDTRKEYEGRWYCHPPMYLRTCYHIAKEGYGIPAR